jgi:hypothetical protein
MVSLHKPSQDEVVRQPISDTKHNSYTRRCTSAKWSSHFKTLLLSRTPKHPFNFSAGLLCRCWMESTKYLQRLWWDLWHQKGCVSYNALQVIVSKESCPPAFIHSLSPTSEDTKDLVQSCNSQMHFHIPSAFHWIFCCRNEITGRSTNQSASHKDQVGSEGPGVCKYKKYLRWSLYNNDEGGRFTTSAIHKWNMKPALLFLSSPRL